MKHRAKPVWYDGASSGTVLGHPVKIEGPQTPDGPHAHGGCCIEIDGNVVYYEIGPNGVHSHSYMHKNFSTPWELAEALARDYGALAVRGGPSSDVAPHDHSAGGADDHHGGPSHRKGRKRKGG
jgi:hypothetical protein